MCVRTPGSPRGVWNGLKTNVCVLIWFGLKKGTFDLVLVEEEAGKFSVPDPSSSGKHVNQDTP